jgi:hypothetical protein
MLGTVHHDTTDLDRRKYYYTPPNGCEKAKTGAPNEIPSRSPVIREVGMMRFMRGGRLAAHAAEDFERGDFVTGVVLTARAAEAYCEGAKLLGVPADGGGA